MEFWSVRIHMPTTGFYIPLQRLRYGEENEIAVSASASVHAVGISMGIWNCCLLG